MNQEEAQQRYEASQRAITGNALALEAVFDMIALDIRTGAPKALDMSNQEYRDSCGLAGIKVAHAIRKDLTMRYLAEGMSQREVAAVLGVDSETVGRDTRGANAPPKDEKPLDEGTLDDENGANAPLDTNDTTSRVEELEAELEALREQQEHADRDQTTWEKLVADMEELREAHARVTREGKAQEKKHADALRNLRKDLKDKEQQVGNLKKALDKFSAEHGPEGPDPRGKSWYLTKWTRDIAARLLNIHIRLTTGGEVPPNDVERSYAIAALKAIEVAARSNTVILEGGQNIEDELQNLLKEYGNGEEV